MKPQAKPRPVPAPQWPADAVERRKVADLIPYARNARTHSEAQVAQIAASIREWGWTVPVLVDEAGGIIAGHGRILAARKLNLADVPVMVARGWSEAQKRAYVLADNKLTLNAGWDDDLLRGELADLKLEGFDLDLTGFGPDELADLLADPTEGLTDPDDVPEPPAEPVSARGDVWDLGSHRLMVGDSTALAEVETLMAPVRADMVFTDPPYGMSYGGGRGEKQFGMIKGDDAQGGDLLAMVREALANAVAVKKPGAAAYVCFTWRTYPEFDRAMRECGLPPKACIVWDKKRIGMSHGHYRPQHEFIFYCAGDSWQGDRAQSDLWTASRDAHGDYVHPTQKPVELIAKALQNSSKAGDVVLDLFGGSGSTLVACEQTGRSARLMELDPRYADVIVLRWQAFTGREATLDGDGRSYADIAAERGAAKEEAA